MTKKEIQAELIRQLKSCDSMLSCENVRMQDRIEANERKSVLKLVLQLVEHLDEDKKA